MKPNTLEKLLKIIGTEKIIEMLTERISELETDNFLLELDKDTLKKEVERLNELLTPTAKGDFDNE